MNKIIKNTESEATSHHPIYRKYYNLGGTTIKMTDKTSPRSVEKREDIHSMGCWMWYIYHIIGACLLTEMYINNLRTR